VLDLDHLINIEQSTHSMRIALQAEPVAVVRCRLLPAADVPSHTSEAAMGQFRKSALHPISASLAASDKAS
jgi:hypothetical protein